MWTEFVAVVIFLGAILLIPGCFLLRAFGMPRAWSVCCAPILGVALISILGQLFAFLGIASNPLNVLAPLVILPALALVLLRKHVHTLPMPEMPAWAPILFVAIGAALGYNLYVSRIGAADAISQNYDVTQHLSLIQSMADSGRLSSLGTSAYLSAADQAIDPAPSTAFYPASWHALCALAVQALGTTAPVAINTSMYVFPCLVFPLAMAAFLCASFEGKRRELLFGGIVTMAFVMFPWALITFGPIYPNVAGFSTVPIAMCLFVRLVSADPSRSERLRFAALLVLAVLGQALLHPNTLFTCVVILAPYCIMRVWAACSQKGLGDLRSIACCAGFALFCTIVWYGCYRLPLFASTVSHIWPPYSRPWQQLVNIITQTYVLGFWYEVATQYALAALVLIGIVAALHTPGRRWLVASYGIACLICLYCATQEGTLKQILGGFWYTDPMRLAAVCCIAAIPLAALGLTWVFELCLGLVTSYNERRGKPTHLRRVAAATTGVFLLVNFMPEFNLPGLHDGLSYEENLREISLQERDRSKNFHTTFGDYREIIEECYSIDSPLDSSERSFLETVHRLVGDELVINDPMDGSFLSYGTAGLRTYYRDFVGFGQENETRESQLIRMGLNTLASNADVQNAVSAIGARYVMVLHQEGSDSSMINLRKNYNPSLFAGISSITTSTPGFKLVYRSGTMCLYEIVL